MNSVVAVLFTVYGGLNLLLSGAILILAVWGLIQLLSTRDDAFTVVDRDKSKWSMLMGGASLLALLALFVPIELLWIIAAVIVGIYWQDIRPSIRDVLDNSSGSW